MRIIPIAAFALAVAACSPDSSSTAQASPDASASALPGGMTAVKGAETFLREALAMYASQATNAAAQADQAALLERTTPAGLRRLFAPALAKSLIRNLATQDGIGIGFDPICMCNDDSAMVIRSIDSTPQPDGRVFSEVSFDSFDASGTNYPALLVYSLEQTPDGWRIAEVVDRRGAEGDVSLMRTLELQ